MGVRRGVGLLCACVCVCETMSRDEEAARVRLYLRKENLTVFKPTKRKVLPVTIVTGVCNCWAVRHVFLLLAPSHPPYTHFPGFLGSGKTTLLNHILTNKQSLKVGAAVNDFASLNIDKALIDAAATHDGAAGGDGVVALSNGCVCCTMRVVDEFKDAVWALLNASDPERGVPGVEEVDYLVVETSGVTDPTNVVASVEAKFGKMTRARLDSVVCVVDADVFAAELAGAPEDRAVTGSAVCAAQLRSADIVLINKRDLVTDDQYATVVEFVNELAPWAGVHSTVKSRIPLPVVLDVAAVKVSNTVTHEGIAAPVVLVNSGGALRHSRSAAANGGKVRAGAGAGAGSGSGGGAGAGSAAPSAPRFTSAAAAEAAIKHGGSHIKADDFKSTAYEHRTLPSWVVMRDFLVKRLPRGVVRAKGFMRFREFPDETWSMHLSGRRRFTLEPHARIGGPDAAPVQLVFIGRGIVPAELDAELDAVMVADAPAADSDETVASCAAMVAEHPKFQGRPSADGSVVHFRAIGPLVAGTTLEEVQRSYGVDLDEMNATLLQSVNASGAGCMFTTEVLNASPASTKDSPDAGLYLRHVVGGACTLAAVWDTLCAEADKAVRYAYRFVPACSCGF